MSNNLNPQAGYYRHYKGRYYQLLAVVRHSEEQAPYALYRALYGDFGLWVRPLAMFCEEVETATGLQPRFAFVGSEVPADLQMPAQLPDQLSVAGGLWAGLSPEHQG